MRYLLVLLIIGLLPILGFYVGTRLARKSDLSRDERKELKGRREFMESITNQAHHHNLLGDNFALIVIDEANKFRQTQS